MAMARQCPCGTWPARSLSATMQRLSSELLQRIFLQEPEVEHCGHQAMVQTQGPKATVLEVKQAPWHAQHSSGKHLPILWIVNDGKRSSRHHDHHPKLQPSQAALGLRLRQQGL